jgi:probable rRNA maturation factor
LPDRHRFRRWVHAALEQDADVTLRIVAEAEGRRLNRDYRGRDYATNVLTFAYDGSVPGPVLSGDVVLCAPVLMREARAQGKDLLAHCAHLTIHGVLHLQGYDHEQARPASIMEAREIEILTRFGFENPYRY